ncbi:MAG: carbonic anhydrase [Syntrophobacteraceae bacterium]
MTSAEALNKLLEGNARFASNQLDPQKPCCAATRLALASGQQPYAIILCCSDSRVPPEIVFDLGLGEIFVVRVAGNVLSPMIMGSIEYAADHLGSPLIVVLGHERCGAVTAAVDSHGEPHGHVGEILRTIAPAVAEARKLAGGKDKPALIEEAIDSNIKMVSQSLPRQSEILSNLMAQNKLKVVSAKYFFDGTVKILDH